MDLADEVAEAAVEAVVEDEEDLAVTVADAVAEGAEDEEDSVVIVVDEVEAVEVRSISLYSGPPENQSYVNLYSPKPRWTWRTRRTRPWSTPWWTWWCPWRSQRRP